uniref:Gamma-tubulin complex component n=3 Tax=Drosophila melanogaster TaxID=7227 RepID=E1JJQ3_DROME|nr:Gamma-tubulin ring protein 84, isoform E [Drosophila melanogaster]ACZ95332.1 Gamma-tubulin ring protein 84, isoform E [Drosophila melanogaster]|eukprot:NP_001162798.1 Gamma-tubulin ring protein 84, isoform E [Drosophila melanogaster]
MSKPHALRGVLANLISESQSPLTPESIIREFRATSDRRLPACDLIKVLVSISEKRPNFAEVTKEISHILQNKDPMYALLVFVERYSECKPVSESSSSTSLSAMGLPHGNKTSDVNSAAGSVPTTLAIASTSTILTTSQNVSGSTRLSLTQSQDFPTSTPVNCKKATESDTTPVVFVRRGPMDRNRGAGKDERNDLSVIKERVLNAVSDQSLSGYRSVTNKTGNSPKSMPNDLVTLTDVPDEYRTHLLWEYYKVDGDKVPRAEIAAMPLLSQESMLLDELLHCLTGIRESLLVPQKPIISAVGLAKYDTDFDIHTHLDRSLTHQVREILPLASYFMGVQKIIAATDGLGQVMNSLNEALQELTHDFYLIIVQAEQELRHNRLTLQKLLYYLQPTMWVMHEVWSSLVIIQLSDSRDAEVLTYLHERIKRLEGNKDAQQLIIGLVRKAAKPYMRMLQMWIQKGVIVDRHREFLVVDNEVIHRDELPEHYSDDYWERRYTLRDEQIPSFLAKYSDKILRTGKYLNVIRQCGKRVMPTQEMNLEFDPTSERHVSVINDAYYFAARMLLDVLLTENDLMGHLQSVKRYLLLNQGDFTMQFMDACEDELTKNVDHVLPMTLENLLGLTLRISSARNDPYKDDLHCELLPYDLVTQMSKIMKKEENWQAQPRLDLSGLECFAFTYEVKWPCSLVLNHISISKYQMLFRQLFYCKHVERQLCKIWKENSIARQFEPQAASLYRAAFTLRQRMMNAIQNLEYYMMIEIIEPNWHIFIEKMKTVENVDNVLRLHQDFLDSCLKNCMLTESSHLNRSIFKLCKICLKYCEFIQIETPLDPTDTFSERVRRFDLEFTQLLISFLKQINSMAKKNTADCFMNLVHRINFNAFYTDQMDKMCVEDAIG